MIELSLHEVARTTAGQLQPTDPAHRRVRGLSIDTRRIEPGALFVALRGEHRDGHDFVAEAAAAGAAAALVERPLDIALPQVIVDSTRVGLSALASAWRARCPARVVAVTGSAGKTTVKQLLKAIFSADAPTLATEGNLNNDLGVPLTLSRLGDTHRWAVIEMGANHLGEIENLCRIARPDIGAITFAGRAHLGEFGGVDAIIRAKGEIYPQLGPDGIAVINLGSAGAERWLDNPGRGRVLSLLLEGDQPRADRRPDLLGRWVAGEDGRSMLAIEQDGAQRTLAQPLEGRHNALNLLVAVAVARAAGLSWETIANGLAGFAAPEGRLTVRRVSDRLTVIDDTYNANPDAFRAAIDVLATRPGHRALVMGDMGELGDQSPALHREVADYGLQRLDAVFALGEDSVAALRAAGGSGGRDTLEELVDAVRGWLAQAGGEPVTLLVKGSRFMHMERVVSALTGTPEGGPSCS
ncbi:MAG: UDP-N-acetylmuramoyl-tripeptide--D-alanyl-D-alanine ligase [Halothiobacillaceae bacterium]